MEKTWPVKKTVLIGLIIIIGAVILLYLVSRQPFFTPVAREFRIMFGMASFQDYADKASAIPSLSYTLIATGENGKSETSTVFIKNGSIRSENPRINSKTGEAEGTLISILNTEKKQIYIYNPDPAVNQAIVKEVGQDADRNSFVIRTPAKILQRLDMTAAKQAGKEEVDGKVALIYDVADSKGADARIWIWEEEGIPLKFSGTLNGQKITLEYKDMKLDEIDAALFDLPLGTTVLK